MSVEPVNVVVFAEDHADWWRDVLRSLLTGMLCGLKARPVDVAQALVFVPDEDIPDSVHQLSVGRAWKNPRDQSLTFTRWVKRFLERGWVVVVHFDGDCLWSERRQHDKAINMAQFQREVLDRLEKNPPDAPDWRERLLLFVPHDELEAWLFQNTEAVRAVLRAAGRLNSGADALLSDWAKDRAALDRTKSPKDQLKSPNGQILVETLCLVPLAEMDFPTAEVRALGSSYAQAMAGVRRCRALRLAVQRATKAKRRAEDAQTWRSVRRDTPSERP